MLFYRFCVFDDFLRINHWSQISAGKSTIKTPYLRRPFSDGNHRLVPIIPDDRGSQKGGPRWCLWGPHHLAARSHLPAREQVVSWPWPTRVSPLSRTSTPRNPKT